MSLIGGQNGTETGSANSKLFYKDVWAFRDTNFEISHFANGTGNGGKFEYKQSQLASFLSINPLEQVRTFLIRVPPWG